jgi:hypothetical protein
MESTPDRITLARQLLAGAQRDIERAVQLLADAACTEPDYHELPPLAPAVTPGERAAAAAHWFDQLLDSDPGFRAFHADWVYEQQRRGHVGS